MTVSLRPHYLAHEFGHVSVAPTYFPDNANAAACDTDSHKAAVNRSVNRVTSMLGDRRQTRVTLPPTLQECVYCHARLDGALERCGGGIFDAFDVHGTSSIQ